MKLLDLMREKVIVLDGGMGTGIQFRAPRSTTSRAARA